MPIEDFEDAMAEDAVAPRMICVGTHHKTGTLWMRWVFRKIAEDLGLQVGTGRSLRDAGIKGLGPDERCLVLHWSSDFTKRLLDRKDTRALHLIRDPRDVLLSGMSYHMKIDPSREGFLAKPDAALDGRSYQEHLNWLTSDEDRLLFEMRGKHAQTVNEMLSWNYSRDTCAEVTYEDLIADTDGSLFLDILLFLGFSKDEAALGRKIFVDRSLFGPMKHAGFTQQDLDIHIQSGKPQRWKTELPRAVAETYAQDFGPALVKLGYESHPTAWLKEIAA